MIDLRSGTWLGQVPLVSRPSLGAGVQEIQDASFSQVLAAPKAIVDFWSPGCPHCVTFKPIYEEVAGQSPDILFAAINTDVSQENAGAYNITGLPSVVFFMNGKEVHRVAGGMSKAGLMNEIQKAFSGGGASPQGLAPGVAPVSGGSGMFASVLGGVALVGVLGAVSYYGYQLLKK